MTKNKMPVSLVVTVFNESSTIVEFLSSIKEQTHLPDEFVIVDGGSTDCTNKKIRDFSFINPEININLISSKFRINIAEGRNIGIKNAKHNLIAVTDAGCKLNKDWLELICSPLLYGNSFDIVSGWYEPWIETDFEKVVADAIFPSLAEIEPKQFYPSSRSIAFRKSAWAKAGGYPEWLTLSAEDTLFVEQLRENGCNFTFEPLAIVKWRPRGDLKSLLWINFSMGRGDGEAKILVLNYFFKLICIIFPLAFIFTKKKFKIFWLRYILSVALVAGWFSGLIRVRRSQK